MVTVMVGGGWERTKVPCADGTKAATAVLKVTVANVEWTAAGRVTPIVSSAPTKTNRRRQGCGNQ